MKTRSITKKASPNQNPLLFNMMEFPKDRDGLIYVRQSSVAQVLKNIHSFEMQTDKFVEHFRNMGCTGNIEIIADDEAMSGTLDIHARPGMTRMMKLIEQKAVGWIGAVHVNRFTRDPWLITPTVLMKTCHDHNVWIATLRMNFNFKDTYCQRVFMLEAEEAARHLEWMRLVLGGGQRAASDKGFYDGRFLVPGYIVDRSDPRRKKYVIYEPHATVIRWLYRRFFELDGDFPALRKEIEKMPYLFPKFESWVDTKNMTKLLLNETAEGHYKPSRTGLRSILTNPVYIGWWIPFDGGCIEDNHEPILDEALFTFAHKRLSTYDLQGERQKPEKVIRYGRVKALLKKVIQSPDGDWVYAEAHGSSGSYKCWKNDTGRLLNEHVFAVSVRTIDAAFLEKFFEHVQSLPKICKDWEDKPEQNTVTNEDRERLIRKSIKAAGDRMRRILELLTPSEEEEEQEPLSQSMRNDLIREYKGLETKKGSLEKELQPEKEEQEDEGAIIYEIATLVPVIMQRWDTLPYEQKLRFIGALVRKVALSQVAPAWMKIEIEWKIEGWGIDVAHIWRYANMAHWTKEEEAVLFEMYPNEDAGDILRVLPDRCWSGIKLHAQQLKIVRSPERRKIRNTMPVNQEFHSFSLKDVEYAKKHELSLSSRQAQWTQRCGLSTRPGVPDHF